MTNQEAIKEFESELKWAELNKYPYVSKQKIEADKMAIKAFKQKSILDKIKDEINLETRVQVNHYTNTDAVIDAVLDVIDKYKIESGG